MLGKDGEYHDVTPVPGAVLVNIGDLLQRWTADKYPSTVRAWLEMDSFVS